MPLKGFWDVNVWGQFLDFALDEKDLGFTCKDKYKTGEHYFRFYFQVFTFAYAKHTNTIYRFIAHFVWIHTFFLCTDKNTWVECTSNSFQRTTVCVSQSVFGLTEQGLFSRQATVSSALSLPRLWIYCLMNCGIQGRFLLCVGGWLYSIALTLLRSDMCDADHLAGPTLCSEVPLKVVSEAQTFGNGRISCLRYAVKL